VTEDQFAHRRRPAIFRRPVNFVERFGKPKVLHIVVGVCRFNEQSAELIIVKMMSALFDVYDTFERAVKSNPDCTVVASM
jgi:hypothetical protein